MRKDFGKVLTERGKVGGYARCKKNYDAEHELSDEARHRESMRSKWSKPVGRKHRALNTAPIHRFFISRLGRPWNDVRSELTQVLKTEGRKKSHDACEILNWQVEQNPEICNGYVLTPDGYFSYCPFYVDEEGLLRQTPKQNWAARSSWYTGSRQKQPSAYFTKDGKHLMAKTDGIWYLYELAPYQVGYHSTYYRDEYGFQREKRAYSFSFDRPGRHFDEYLYEQVYEYSYHRLLRFYGGRYVYATGKKQMNSKELHDAGLANDNNQIVASSRRLKEVRA